MSRGYQQDASGEWVLFDDDMTPAPAAETTAQSSLVERLRDMIALAADSCDPEFNRAVLEAAAEIERLEEREQSYRLALAYLSKATDIPTSLAAIASEALKTKALAPKATEPK